MAEEYSIEQRLSRLENAQQIIQRILREEVSGAGGSPGALPRKIAKLQHDLEASNAEIKNQIRLINELAQENRIEIRGDGSDTKPGLNSDVFLLKQSDLQRMAQFNLVRIAALSCGGVLLGIFATMAINLADRQHRLELELGKLSIDVQWLKN